MFCSNCGTQVPDNTRFCSNCGTQLGSASAPSTPDRSRASHADTTQNQKPLLVVRPKLVAWVAIVGGIFPALFGTVFVGMFGGMFGGMFMLKVLNLSAPATATIITVLLVTVFLVFLLLPYIVHSKTYQKTRYGFYANHLEYFEGFWTVEKKIIRYDQITDIHVRRGVVQKSHNIGTITLSTMGSGPEMRSGIRMADIPNPDALADKITDLIGLRH